MMLERVLFPGRSTVSGKTTFEGMHIPYVYKTFERVYTDLVFNGDLKQIC